MLGPILFAVRWAILAVVGINEAGGAGGARTEGARNDLELAIFSGEEVWTFALPAEGAVTIGRGEGSAIRIDDPSVSRSHAVLLVGRQLTIQDLGSANGTMVRGRGGVTAPGNDTLNVRQLFERKAPLAVGDSLLFGTTSVVLRHRPSTPAPELTEAEPGVIIRDPAMRLLYEQAALAARATINVLILGETGVGKEVLARSIHAGSRRANGVFLGINCAALTESLQESELFGVERGAFTGANQSRPGLFEAANGGTVFLDEVGDLSVSAQVKLLRVLEERTVTRLGSTRERPVDVRFLAATNRDLEHEAATSRFRTDLFFRLNGLTLLIPPLRDRPGEIEPLARMFLTGACREVEREVRPSISGAAMEILRKYRWPGNVRELRNTIDRAVVLCPGDAILPEHLPASLLRSLDSARKPMPLAPTRPDAPRSADVPRETARILEALERSAWNQTRAARILGMSRGTLIARLDELGLPRPRKRDQSVEE